MEAFYKKCFVSNFPNPCFAGFSILFFGFIFSILNLYAFIKMTKYYRKMNFENTILLLSSIQSLALIIEIIISKNVLISVFIFIQILSMCLINLKFKKISKGFVDLKYYNLTIIIIVTNFAYLFIFITLFIIINIKHLQNILFYLNAFYYILELFSSFLLSYNCCVFLGLMKPKKSNNDNNKTKNENNNNNQTDTNIKKLINLSNLNGGVGKGLFYLIKKRQISLLYLGNILCSFFALGIDTVITLILTDKTKNVFNYIYYAYFLLCFIHNSINFICFYWMIKEQYKKEKDIKINENEKDGDIDKLIDDQYIEEEINNINNENTKINRYIKDEEKNKNMISFDSFETYMENSKDNDRTKDNIQNNSYND